MSLILPDRAFTRTDLPELGLTTAALRTAIVDGAVLRVVPGVYLPAGLPDTVETRAKAVQRVVPDHQVITDRTAAAIHGIDLYTYAEHDLPLLIEMCALRGQQPTELRGTDGHTRDLAARDMMEVAGMIVTTPLRTALDCGCNLRRRDAFAALNGLAGPHGLTVEMLTLEAQRFKGRRGVRQLRPLIADLEPEVESVRESWTLRDILDEGFPRPVPQHWVVVGGVELYRLDFAWPRLRVCVEYNGFEDHERTPEQIEADRTRREHLERLGWTVVVVRRGDFTGVNRARWIGEVRSALRPSYSNRRF